MIIVKNRELLIPNNERYIGTTYDDNSTIRTFRVSRFNEDGMDKSQLDFYVIINYYDGSDPDAVGVTKSVSDDYIVLEWDVGEDVTEHGGSLFLWVRGFDHTGAVRWSSFPGVFYIEESGTAPTDLSNLERRISEEDKLLRLAKLFKSQPMTAAMAAEMVNREQIYVYIGNESGYNYGYWYFWNGSAWVPGGVYNAIAVQTDNGLTAENIPADARAAGEKLAHRYDTVAQMKADNNLKLGMYAITGGYHAVNDGGSALYRIYYGIPTGQYYETLANGLYAVLIMSDTVCPEMFGAVGDGSTNDTTALLSAVNSGRTVIGNKKYKINPEQSFSGKKLKNLHLYFESNAALTSAVMFNNCVIEGCTFESVNDKPSPWNGASGNFSNIFISSNGSEFTGCTFKNLEYLSLGADGEIISGCRFVGCAGGISGNHSNHVRIINCIFDLLTYAGELEHAIYTSNDCSDWVIDGISVTGCQYYPLHIYNSHEGDNPKNITVANSSFYDAKWVVANNGDLNIVNCHFDNSDNNIERLLFANGTTKFKNCDIDVSNVLFILSGDKGVTFENCSIKCEDLVAAFGTSTSEKVTLTIKNCTMNVKHISRYDRSVELRSYNNVYNDIVLLINNTDPSVLADLFFSNDVFNGDGDLIYANHFTLVMLGCYINRDTAAFIIASRSTTSGNTAFMSNNTARVSGNYITYTSGITNLGKNNCFNINP